MFVCFKQLSCTLGVAFSPKIGERRGDDILAFISGSLCENCVYKSLKKTRKCEPILCVYGALNLVARELYSHAKSDALVQSHPTFVVGCEENISQDENKE